MDCQVAISSLNPEAGLGQVGKEGHAPQTDSQEWQRHKSRLRIGTCVSLEEGAASDG